MLQNPAYLIAENANIVQRKCEHKPTLSGGKEGSDARTDNTSVLGTVTKASKRLATKLASGSFSPQDKLRNPSTLEETHKRKHIESSKTAEKPKTQLSTNSKENKGDGDDVYSNCSNCALPMWKGNCHRNYLQRKNPPAICNKCYKYLWRTGQHRPVASPPATQPLLEFAEDEFNKEVDGSPSLLDDVESGPESEHERLPQCDHCKVKTSKRIRRWKSTDHRLCDPCYMYRYNHKGMDRPIEHKAMELSCGNCGLLPPKRLRRFQLDEGLLCDRCYAYRLKNNADRPLDSHENDEDATTNDAVTDHAHPRMCYEEAGAGFTYHLAKENKCLTAQCAYCGWKQTQNPTEEKQHRHACSALHPFKTAGSSIEHKIPNHSNSSTPHGKPEKGYGQEHTGLENDVSHKNVLVTTSGTGNNHSVAQEELTAARYIHFQEEGKKCLTVQCTRCGWQRASNPTREKEHQRECWSGRTFQERGNAIEKVANGVSQVQRPQPKFNASRQDNSIHASSDRPTIAAAAPKTATVVPFKAFSEPLTLAPNFIAPGEIQALFCQPPPLVPNAHGADDGPLPLSIRDHVTGKTVRLLQPQPRNEEGKATAIASMRAQGIDVIGGMYLEPDTSWSDDSDMSEADSCLFQPISLVQSARYRNEPDPRRWVDDDEDDKSRSFNILAAQRKIQARPRRSANVKARRNGTRPGKLLAMSDWQTRVRRYGILHRETERNPGPQKVGTFIREVADRTKLTVLKGFDDPETVRAEVHGTMQEFLGLPRQVKYDLIGAPRLVAARTLAFSDATGRERLPDRDKFPVGMGG